MFKPSNKKNYIFSGIFIFSLMLLITFTVLMINKENPMFSDDIIVHTEVSNVQNLKEGASIQLRGIRVGSVKEINIKDLHTIIIKIGINQKYAPWVKTDSLISFKNQGVLGDKFLEISGGSLETSSIKDGDFIRTNEKSVIDQFLNKGEDLMISSTGLLNRLEQILSKIEDKKVSQIVSHLEGITKNTNDIVSTINSTRLNDSIVSLDESSKAFKEISNRIQYGPGTLHSIIYDQSLHEDLKSILGGANRNKVLKFFIRESIKNNESNNN